MNDGKRILTKEIMDGYHKFIEEKVTSGGRLYRALSDLNDIDR